MTATAMTRYTEASKQADSIRNIDSNVCQVYPGSNDGYFIEAFGKRYRFACICDPQVIAQLFVDIVAIGPVDEIA